MAVGPPGAPRHPLCPPHLQDGLRAAGQLLTALLRQEGLDPVTEPVCGEGMVPSPCDATTDPPHAPHPPPPTSTMAGATSVHPLSSLGCNLLLPWGDVGGPPHPKSNVGSLCPPLTTGSAAGRGSTAGSPPPCVPRRGSSPARRSCRCCEEKNPPIAPHKQWGWGTAPRVGGIGDTLT